MAFLRLVAILLAGLTVLYLLISIALQARHRRRLGARVTEDAMQVYRRRLRRWLPWAVYVIPLAAFAGMVHWMNS